MTSLIMGEGHFLQGKPGCLWEEKRGMDAGKSTSNVHHSSFLKKMREATVERFVKQAIISLSSRIFQSL